MTVIDPLIAFSGNEVVVGVIVLHAIHHAR